jgi:dipeptide transport system ATP-binding protein
VPGRDDRPAGCLFAPRCKYAVDDCLKGRPALAPLDAYEAHHKAHEAYNGGMRARCIKPLNLDSLRSSTTTTHGGAR